MTIRGTWRANPGDSANSVHTAPPAGVNHCPYAVQFWRANALGGENRLACVHPLQLEQQLDAEFLQSHFRDLCSTAVVLGKQENRIRKLPPRCVIGKPTIGDDGHQYWPSDVKRLEQAVKRSGKPYGRYVLMIVQTLSLPRQLLFVQRVCRRIAITS